MGIMQLLNIILFWIFLGFLSSYFASRKNRHPLTWFFIGITLGILGVLLSVMLPPVAKKKATQTQAPQPLTPIVVKKSDAWIKAWYYLDGAHLQQGPLEFPDLIKKWKERGISETSYIWGEGMKEWKRLAELPELKREFEQV